MKKIMIAATLAGALFTATIATAQKKAATKTINKTEQMQQSTAKPMEQKATTTKKVKAKAVKGENATKEAKHDAKKKETEVKKK